jgi:RecA-family ATPase
MDPEITALRLRLRANGYSPIPVEGKIPRITGWQTWFDMPEDKIRGWSSNAYFAGLTNTGLLTRHNPFLDIDLYHPEAVEEIIDMLCDRYGDNVMVRTGMPPKRGVLFQLSGEPFAKYRIDLIPPGGPDGRKHGIELLSDGQQFVGFGIHPDTHKDFFWNGGRPDQVNRNELPGLSKENGYALIDACASIALKHGYQLTGTRKADGNGFDRDTYGFDWTGIFNDQLDHDALASTSMAMLRAGMNDGAAFNLLHACIVNARSADPDRQSRRLQELPGIFKSARAKLGEPEPQKPAAPSIWITGETLTSTPAPAQEWSVRDLIPARQVCLFSGHGAVGKSSTALHLAAAHALKRAWLRFDPTPGPAFFIDAEDDLDVIHRRLEAILAHYEDGAADLADLHILSLAGKGAVMATANRSGIVEPTALYREIYQRAGDLKPQQIIIASSANVFAGSEMDRSQVTQFIDLLNRIAILTSGSVILISHPSLTGLNTNSGISGSTSWHNAVRARFYMKFITNGGDEQDSSDLRVLEFQKNQYGPPAQSLTLRFRNGLFVAETDGVSNLDKLAREAKAEQKFRDLLRRMIDGNRPVSAKPTARNYAPTAFAREPDPEGLDKRDFENAMKRLFLAKAIEVKQYGKPSLGWERIEFV